MELRLLHNPVNSIFENQDFNNFLTRYNQEWEDNMEPIIFYNDGERLDNNRVDDEDWRYCSY
jgi:hypothetical protein